MSGKILGENNENVDYLTKETGAVISLRGKGSGCAEGKDEELHVLVKYVLSLTREFYSYIIF